MEPLMVIYLCLTVIFLIVCAIILHDKIVDRRERKESRTRTSSPATENGQDSLLRQVIAGLDGLPNDASYSQIKAVLDQVAFTTMPDPIRHRALEVFGDEDKAGEWLTTKITVLGGQTPMAILINTEGEKEVLAILGRIEHGVFS